ncbi:MAG: hypothetical protein ACI9MR_002677 [Myxococcota bacterium]|jgi:hypothetical protein
MIVRTLHSRVVGTASLAFATGVLLAACGTAGWSAGPGVLLACVLAIPVLWASRARGGARTPCQGTETVICSGGHLRTQCCPTGSKCNYRNVPFQRCGTGLCVEGQDVGRCKAPQPATTGAEDEADCKKSYGGWAPACVKGEVTDACIMSVPTNFTGPPRNPHYQTLLWNMCTTHLLPSDGLLVRHWLTAPFCIGEWKAVCLNGELSERCIPFPGLTAVQTFPATTYVTCPDDSCAVGTDANRVCPK